MVLIRILVALSAKDVIKLKSERILQLSELCTTAYSNKIMVFLAESIKAEINCNTANIVGVSRVLNSAVTLKKCFMHLQNYLAITSGIVVIEADVPKDLVLNMDYLEFLAMQDSPKLSLDDWKDKLFLGDPKKRKVNDAVCFVPRLKLSECLRFVCIDSEWNATETLTITNSETGESYNEAFELPGVEKIHVSDLEVF